jgi:hypothetical protein
VNPARASSIEAIVVEMGDVVDACAATGLPAVDRNNVASTLDASKPGAAREV